ncbi:MAG: TlpA disulfide reductase family protein, partial [Planctomycetota bacterium]
IERNKLQASLQLKNHAQATERLRVDGARGQLQSLSHLAAMGDLASANALGSLARENLSDPDPGIVMDSRIVLIGFAIDALQSGEAKAADRIVELVKALGQHDAVDIPAILTMGQARQVLSSYGQVEQAKAVREHILELYGNSSDSMIAKVAAEAAGTVKFDAAERLVRAIVKRDDVSLAFWSDAAIELATESPDMSVVQYLAGAALRFEAGGRETFVEETFRILEEQFSEPDAATTREVALAKNARQARREVIGRLFDPDLPTVDGSELTMESYRGKIVMMPFWAVSVPESLQIVGQLRAIRDKYPGEVEIVGMNLDTADAPLPEFLAATDLEFLSYRSVSSAKESGANPVAERFGLVSLPFVVVMDKEARVVALDFTGTKVKSVVDELLQVSSDDGEPR